MESGPAIISADSLAARLGDTDLRVVDTRFSLADPEAGRRAYSVGHVPGAVYLHLDEDLSGAASPGTGRHPLPAPEAFASCLGRAGIGSRHRVVVYDDASGAIAARFWWMLRWLGHHEVAVLDGGYSAWQSGKRDVSTDAGSALPAEFAPVADPGLVVTSDQVQHLVSAGRMLLVDARERERFLGEAEPIDRVAGRIPGAVSFPFRDNLDESGRLLPAADLRRRWAPLLAGWEPAEVACMCGSGVTACLDLLAMEVAGFGGATLYAGSWSEWITDPGRPVAVGAP